MPQDVDAIRFAIVGCGRIAERHAEHISHVGSLRAVCDCEKSRVLAFASRHKVRAYRDIDAMLAEESGGLDLVAVCTPNGLHAEHTIKALNAGAHVLCEKPMAITTQDCGRMIQAAERANRRLFVVKQNRFNPPVAAVKKLLDDGTLGPICSLHLNCLWNRNPQYYKETWKGTLDMDGGCLYTQFSHFIDLLYWFVGDIEGVAAFVHNHAHQDLTEFEDGGVVAIRFASGALGSIHFTTNSFGRNMEGSLTLVCQNGTVKIGGQYLNELEYHNIENCQIADLPTGNPANAYGEYTGSMSNHDLVYDNIVNVLVNDGTVMTNAYEGLKTVEIIERIYRAAAEARGHTATWPVPKDDRIVGYTNAR